MLCPSGWAPVWRTETLTETCVTEFCYKSVNLFLEELINIKEILCRNTLGISGWGCAAGTLEPLTCTRASSAEFCYPILE